MAKNPTPSTPPIPDPRDPKPPVPIGQGPILDAARRNLVNKKKKHANHKHK